MFDVVDVESMIVSWWQVFGKEEDRRTTLDSTNSDPEHHST